MKAPDKRVGEALTLATLLFNLIAHVPQPLDVVHETRTVIQRGEDIVIVVTDALPLSSVVVSDDRHISVVQHFDTFGPSDAGMLLASKRPCRRIQLRISLLRTQPPSRS